MNPRSLFHFLRMPVALLPPPPFAQAQAPSADGPAPPAQVEAVPTQTSASENTRSPANM